VAFIGKGEHGRVTNRAGLRYGAILWDAVADIDAAIRVVKRFDNPQEAVRLVAPCCAVGQKWAVVDLISMRVVAKGSSQSGQGIADPGWPFSEDLQHESVDRRLSPERSLP
jgi:hypothetical protein